MARLPDPVTNELMIQWQEESAYKASNKTFFSMLGESVRKAESIEKRKEDENEGN